MSQEKVKQLHDRGVFEVLDVVSATEEEKKEALSSLMFLKEKRDGAIKGQACANGRPQ